MPPNFWANGLLQTMKEPKSIVIKTSKLVAIKDKFSKAKHHYLICPYEDIDDISELRKEHVELVEEMYGLALQVIESQNQLLKNFKIGFHAIPSMSRSVLSSQSVSRFFSYAISSFVFRLHLHVVSMDFCSPCLKKKNHWNSFNTDFLVTCDRVIKDLREQGRAVIDMGQAECMLNVALVCNSCPYIAKSMPDLKRHLVQHETLYEAL